PRWRMFADNTLRAASDFLVQVREATRAAYAHPRLRPLLPQERQLLLADARINERGVCANVPFLQAAEAFPIRERNAINTRINELTCGVVSSVNQVTKIMETINACGHDMTTLNKRSVAATLAHQPRVSSRNCLNCASAAPTPARPSSRSCSPSPMRRIT